MATVAGGVCLVVVLLLIQTTLSHGHLKIDQPPQNTTVFLNTNARFSCRASDFKYIYWNINGFNRNNNSAKYPNTSVIPPNSDNIATLTILGNTHYNGTQVNCKAGDGDAMTESKNATLLVQGKLESVGNLTISDSNEQVFISWTAPFSLNVTNKEVDIWYTVLIHEYNVNDKMSPKAVPLNCTNCTGIVDTYYTFIPEHPSPCIQFFFTVVPHNGAGQGESSHNITGHTINPGLDVKFKKSRTNNNMTGITFFFTGQVNDVCYYILHLMDEYIHIDGESSDGKIECNPCTIADFEPNMIVEDIDCDIVNAATSITLPVSFSTYDVQEVWTRRKQEEIEVTAELIETSEAKGCFVVVECNNVYFYRALLQRENMAAGLVRTPSVNGTESCRVIVYDIEKDGLPTDHSSPAVVVQGDTDTFNEQEQYHNKGSNSHIKAGKNCSEEGVQIRCTFADDHPNESCVVFYHEKNSTTLKVKEYNSQTLFPKMLIRGNTENNYSIAVFGMNERREMDPEPLKTEPFNLSGTSSVHHTDIFLSFLPPAMGLLLHWGASTFL